MQRKLNKIVINRKYGLDKHKQIVRKWSQTSWEFFKSNRHVSTRIFIFVFTIPAIRNLTYTRVRISYLRCYTWRISCYVSFTRTRFLDNLATQITLFQISFSRQSCDTYYRRNKFQNYIHHVKTQPLGAYVSTKSTSTRCRVTMEFESLFISKPLREFVDANLPWRLWLASRNSIPRLRQSMNRTKKFLPFERRFICFICIYTQ